MANVSTVRQRRKDRTRAALVTQSQRLFRSQGYDATTLEQVAAASGVSVPTLLGYFPSKERLALAPEYDRLERFRLAVADPARVEDTLSLWRRAVADGASVVMRDTREHRGWMKDRATALSRGVLALLQQYEDILAEGLAHDGGTTADALEPRALATLLSFSNHSVLRRWTAADGAPDLRELALQVVDLARLRVAVALTLPTGRPPGDAGAVERARPA